MSGQLRKTHMSICMQCNNEGGQGVAAHCAKMGATHLFFFAHCTATTIISFCAAWRASAIGRHGALHARKQCDASFSLVASNAISRDFFPRACCLSIVAPVVRRSPHLDVHVEVLTVWYRYRSYLPRYYGYRIRTGCDSDRSPTHTRYRYAANRAEYALQ